MLLESDSGSSCQVPQVILNVLEKNLCPVSVGDYCIAGGLLLRDPPSSGQRKESDADLEEISE